MKKEIDPKLDYLYNTTVRCPYCHSRILKYTSVCPRCGITKHQIHGASNKRAKEIMKNKTGELIFMSRRRPDDVTFTGMALRSFIGGLFGWHCFYCGRKIRGWIMLICGVVGLVGVACTASPKNPMRMYFESHILFGTHELLPPFDLLLIVAFCLHALDFFCIALGAFKYPVRLGEPLNATTKK